MIKQEVLVGETNANEAVIKSGLQETDRVYLSVPIGVEDQLVKLLPELDGKRNKEQTAEKAKKISVVPPSKSLDPQSKN